MTQKYVGSGLREKFICHKRPYIMMKCIKKELSRFKKIQYIYLTFRPEDILFYAYLIKRP